MKRLRSRAARRALILLCALTAFAACSDMGSGSDPVETEGAFLFELPFELKPGAIKPKAAEETSEGEEPLENAESAAPPADTEEPPQESAKPAVAIAPPHEEASPLEDARSSNGSNASAEPLPAANEPLEEGIAVSRYFLSMVSALGFSQYEEIEPSEKTAKVIAQAGRWKIVVVAEGPNGEPIARCELAGVALSAGEEKAVALEWEAP